MKFLLALLQRSAKTLDWIWESVHGRRSGDSQRGQSHSEDRVKINSGSFPLYYNIQYNTILDCTVLYYTILIPVVIVMLILVPIPILLLMPITNRNTVLHTATCDEGVVVLLARNLLLALAHGDLAPVTNHRGM